MNTNEIYEQMAVKIICNGKEGSGCLFQPSTEEYSYVFTARHCLLNEGQTKDNITKDDIVIKRFEADEDTQKLTIKSFFVHPNKEIDIAVILVEYLDDIPKIEIGIPTKKKEVTIFGYPDHLKDKKVVEKRQDINFIISRTQVRNDIFEIYTNTPLNTYFDNTPQLIEGFSGCGIFLEYEDNISLVGILRGLKTPNGGYQRICATDICVINKILGEMELPDLTPSCLSSFKSYLEEAFSSHEKVIAAILEEKANDIDELTPKVIINLLNERLFIPHEKNNLLNNEIWSGWLQLLTYLYIEKNEKLNQNNYLVRLKKGLKQNIKFYYSESLKTLDEVIKYLFTKSYSNLRINDCIIINTPHVPGKTSLKDTKLQNIVRQIDVVDLIKNRNKINEPGFTKDITCTHIYEFKQKLSNIDDDDIYDYDAFIHNIRECIRGVLDNAI